MRRPPIKTMKQRGRGPTGSETMPDGGTGIGAFVKRVEDKRFLTGRGNYTDDINRPGQTYAYILRSSHAHARIDRIDTSAAAAPGVLAVFTGEDMQVGSLPCGWQVHSKDGSPMHEPPHPPLPRGKVRSEEHTSELQP